MYDRQVMTGAEAYETVGSGMPAQSIGGTELGAQMAELHLHHGSLSQGGQPGHAVAFGMREVPRDHGAFAVAEGYRLRDEEGPGRRSTAHWTDTFGHNPWTNEEMEGTEQNDIGQYASTCIRYPHLPHRAPPLFQSEARGDEDEEDQEDQEVIVSSSYR